jgi:hypothetical protein
MKQKKKKKETEFALADVGKTVLAYRRPLNFFPTLQPKKLPRIKTKEAKQQLNT